MGVSHCYFCDMVIPHADKRSWGGSIIFCSRKHFMAWLNFNRPQFVRVPSPELIANRAQILLDELKDVNLRSSPQDPGAIIRESIIYELTFILEGHERVTKQERCVPAMQVK
jgi:hypothetical protein